MISQFSGLKNPVSSDKQSYDQQRALAAKVVFKGDADSGSAGSLLKFAHSKPGHGGNLARVGSRRVARAERELMVNTDSADFSWMDSSRMVTTRSWGSPGVDVFNWLSVKSMEPNRFSDSDRSGVAHIDRNNFFPADANLIERVGDSNSLVKDNDFRTDKDQPRSQRYQSCPERSGNSVLNREVGKALGGIDRCGDENNSKEDKAASRPETLWISHPTIISRSEQR